MLIKPRANGIETRATQPPTRDRGQPIRRSTQIRVRRLSTYAVVPSRLTQTCAHGVHSEATHDPTSAIRLVQASTIAGTISGTPDGVKHEVTTP